MLESILKRLCDWLEKRGRVLKITGTAGPEDVYLIRYYVVKSKWFNVFIHIFLRSDRDDMHDHPWNFATYLVRGTYTEKRGSINNVDKEEFVRRVNNDLGRFNRLVFRKAEDLHQVLVDEPYALKDKDRAPMTLFVSGRTRREWGFVKKEYYHCGYVGGWVNKWIPWREYLGLPSDTPGRG